MSMNEGKRRPITYDYDIDVHFADLDVYGHVNLSKYLDLVVSSRFLYLERILNVSLADATSKGIAVYTAKATQEFLRPINGMKTVKVRSFVSEVDGNRLTVPFEILSPQGNTLYAKGVLLFVVIDLKSNRPVAEIPDFVLDYFLEKK
jgi:acyl-CoA thioesterase FadM